MNIPVVSDQIHLVSPDADIQPAIPSSLRLCVFALKFLSLLSLIVGGVSHASADDRPALTLVSTDDPLLASLFIARGVEQPVVLYDPRDQELVAGYAATWDGPVHCFHRTGTPVAVVDLMKQAAGEPCTPVGDLVALARTLWPHPQRAVTVSDGDYGWLLAATAFAGATGSALLPTNAGAAATPQDLASWPLDTVYLTPPAVRAKTSIAAVVPHVIEIDDPDRFVTELQTLQPNASALIIGNPTDRTGIFSPSGLSLLAPLLSAVHHAPLLLIRTNAAADIERAAYQFIERHRLAISHVLLVGDELALRSHRVPDPVRAAGGPEARGGGTEIRVELFSEIQNEQPQDLVVGRIVAESASQASVMLARQLHEVHDASDRPVVFLTNADAVFALGETISRTTVEELRNLKIPVKAYFRGEITPELTKRVLGQTDMLVWEGHPRDLTLEEAGGVAAAKTPQLVVLQGCYTLDRSDPFILMEKGTQAIVATSAAIYSASGSAFARAFVDAVAYDGRDLGTAVRDARNYLLALAQLKRARQHADWRKTYRAALAFALWGDPTRRAPLPAGHPVEPPIHWSQSPQSLTLTIPKTTLRESVVGGYRAQPAPGAMLGGLLLRSASTTDRRLKDLYLATVPSPDLHAACSAGPGWDVISLYAPRSQTLTVLARPDWEIVDANAHGTYTLPLVKEQANCPSPSHDRFDPKPTSH